MFEKEENKKKKLVEVKEVTKSDCNPQTFKSFKSLNLQIFQTIKLISEPGTPPFRDDLPFLKGKYPKGEGSHNPVFCLLFCKQISGRYTRNSSNLQIPQISQIFNKKTRASPQVKPSF